MNFTVNNAKPIVKQSFVFHTRFTTSATVAQFRVDPINSATAFGTQLGTIGACYQEFRCVGLEIEMFPIHELAAAAANAETNFAISYEPMDPFTNPATIDDVVACSVSAMTCSGVSVPVKFKLTRAHLNKGRQVKWFHMSAQSPTDTNQQGFISYVASGSSSGTAVMTWLVKSQWEFRAPVAAGEDAKSLTARLKKIESTRLWEDEKLALKVAPHSDSPVVRGVPVADLANLPSGDLVLVSEPNQEDFAEDDDLTAVK